MALLVGEPEGVWLGAVWLGADVADVLVAPRGADWTGPVDDASAVVLVKLTGGIGEDNTDVLVDCIVELDIVGAPDVRIPGADWLVAVWVGLNVRLKPAELGLLWLTGAPAEVEAPVLLTAEETLVMIGVGIPVAVRLTDGDDDNPDPLSGPAELAD